MATLAQKRGPMTSGDQTRGDVAVGKVQGQAVQRKPKALMPAGKTQKVL